MKISIITINYNGSDITTRLIESLKRQTDKDFNLFIIDNDSEESDFNSLNSYINSVSDIKPELIRSEENLGFSGGNNLGIEKGLENGSEWVVLLNNDTRVENDFIAGLKLVLGHGGGIRGIALNEGDKIAYYGKIRWLRPTLHHSYSTPASVSESNGKYAIGGAMAIHRSVFEKIGGLDEKYFLYFEDADFSVRAKKAGFAVNFTNDVMAYHGISESTRKLGSPLLLRYHYRNSLYFNFKNGPWYIKLSIWPWSFWIMKKQLLKIMFMFRQNESLEILKGIIDFYKNKMGKI